MRSVPHHINALADWGTDPKFQETIDIAPKGLKMSYPHFKMSTFEIETPGRLSKNYILPF